MIALLTTFSSKRFAASSDINKLLSNEEARGFWALVFLGIFTIYFNLDNPDNSQYHNASIYQKSKQEMQQFNQNILNFKKPQIAKSNSNSKP